MASLFTKGFLFDLLVLSGFIGVIALSLTGNGSIALAAGFIVEDLIGIMAVVALVYSVHYIVASTVFGDTKKTVLFFLGIYCFTWILTLFHHGFVFRKFIVFEISNTDESLISAVLSPFANTFTVMCYIFMPVVVLSMIFEIIGLLTTKNEKEAVPLFLRFLIMFSALFFLLHFKSTLNS